MDKPAPVDHPVHELVRERWSPRAFDKRPIEEFVMRSLLEAARWAPSSRNSQPWRFLVVQRSDEENFARILECLEEANRRWAAHAAALVIAVAVTTDHRGRPLTHGIYDTGQAVAWMSTEATARGVRVHQMGGFDPLRVRALLGVPETAEPIVAIALGYSGDPQTLDASLRDQELALRHRRPLSELVFGRSWGEPA